MYMGREETCFVCHLFPMNAVAWVSEAGKLLLLELPAEKIRIQLKPGVTIIGDGAARISGNPFWNFVAGVPRRVSLCLLYLCSATLWVSVLGIGSAKDKRFWITVLVGAVTCEAAFWVLSPIQSWYNMYVTRPVANAGVNIFAVSTGSLSIAGLLQETLKLGALSVVALVLFLRRRETLPVPFGTALGAGFGVWEAGKLTVAPFVTGILPPIAVFERFFGVMFHAAVGTLIAYGIAKRRPLRFYALCAFLHAGGNYTLLLYRQQLVDMWPLEIIYALADTMILVGTVLLLRMSRPMPQLLPQVASGSGE
jgi:hypothetical protein